MRPTFLLGCQRSGTTALLDAFTLSPHVRAFGEGDPEVMVDYRLRDAPIVLRALAAVTGTPVLKPICESHHADRILTIRPDARVIWLYRQAADVATSTMRKWPGHMLEVAARLHTRNLVWLDWRAEGIGADLWRQLDGMWRPDLTEPEAGAIFWYLRNQWFFAHDLAADPRVLLVRYEDLARRPAVELARLFEFAEVPFEPRFAAAYHAESVGKGSGLSLSASIQRACDDLSRRLQECSTRAAGRRRVS